MASFIKTGTNNNIVKYTDNNSKSIRLVIAHIVDYMDVGNDKLKIETTTGGMTIKLDDKAAVTSAISLLDSIF